ncbi:protein ExsB [Bacteroidales bacterium KA00344]|nr:protein ExsB [Bacteroidales bacterium KA00344]
MNKNKTDKAMSFSLEGIEDVPTQGYRDSVIIVSGGMDSITMLHEFKDRIALGLSFDYGSNHNAREIPFAELHCKRLGISHLTIPLDFMGRYFKSSLLEGADAIPEGDYDEDNMKSTVVPFRNGIMLSIAAGIAESRNLKYVMMANHSGDHTIYPDCRPEFVSAMSEAIKAGTFPGIEILAPYTGITKGDIARRGKEIGLDYTETWSCYKGGEKHCGKCGTCCERIEALREAGIEDHTEYED